MEQTHATTVSLDGRGLMLIGPSGIGKSDLALRLISEGAKLVADDRTDLTLLDGHVMAAPPEAIAGKFEIRGFGVVDLSHVAPVALALVVELVGPEEIERLPDPKAVEILGHPLPLVRLHAFEASAVAKLRFILTKVISGTS